MDIAEYRSKRNKNLLFLKASQMGHFVMVSLWCASDDPYQPTLEFAFFFIFKWTNVKRI